MTQAARAARIVDAVAAAHGVKTVLEPAAGGSLSIRLIFRQGLDETLFGQTRAARLAATGRIPFVDAPDLREGDRMRAEGRWWRVQGQPLRPGDGRWWKVPLGDAGEA